MKFDVYKMVNELIIEKLEAGVIPWKMTWKSNAWLPMNLVSGHFYRGFNHFFLKSFHFERNLFLTFNQIVKYGASVKRGAKSYVVVFFKMFEVERAENTEKIPMLRYYRVFNIEDVEGIPDDKIPETDSHDHNFKPIEMCDLVYYNWKDSPKLAKSSLCAYSPELDEIFMPDPRSFYEDEHYYASLFHEMIHATGHWSRLNRFSKIQNNSVRAQSYSQEELVAELGASYLCTLCGIDGVVIDNSAAYINGWLNRLKSDKKFFFQAASEAQKAVDYILINQLAPEVFSMFFNPVAETA